MIKKVGLVIMISMIICCGCAPKYECSWCKARVHEAYYDPFRDDTYYCEDCAKDYFSPIPYSAYKVD